MYYIPLTIKTVPPIVTFPPSMVSSFIEKSKMSPSVIFFYLFDEKDGMFLEFDLEKIVNIQTKVKGNQNLILFLYFLYFVIYVYFINKFRHFMFLFI